MAFAWHASLGKKEVRCTQTIKWYHSIYNIKERISLAFSHSFVLSYVPMMKVNCCKWSLNKLLFFSYKSFFIFFFIIIWNTWSNYVTIFASFTSFLYFGLAVRVAIQYTCNGYTQMAVATIIWLMQTTCNTLIRKIITGGKYRFWFRKMEIGTRSRGVCREWAFNCDIER